MLLTFFRCVDILEVGVTSRIIQDQGETKHKEDTLSISVAEPNFSNFEFYNP